MCKGCLDLANSARALLNVELRKAEIKADAWLEQFIYGKGLLRVPEGLEIPHFEMEGAGDGT